MFSDNKELCNITEMSNQRPDTYNARPSSRTGHDSNNSSGFDRNKFRQTMPSSSRFNPMSPSERHNKTRPGVHNKNVSPTQSLTSTATNYAPPWNSPKIRPPIAGPIRSNPNEEEPRFRRTHSMAARKGEQDDQKKADRPRINFKDFRKSIANKFKKGESKKPENARMSAPNIKLAENSVSQPQLPTTSAAAASPATASPKKGIRPSGSLKMQLEDRRKMYQKMGREQAMKVSNVQRMQRERQRDFTVVPGLGRACLETSTNSMRGSTQSIESMVVYSSPSLRSGSLSMTDDDVEPVFKNSLTNKGVTSSQMATMKNKQNQKLLSSGPSFTSTPKLSGTVSESPTISNVRSVSESSFCLMTSNEATPAARQILNMNETMYYSTIGLVNTGRETPSGSLPPSSFPVIPNVPIASTSTTPIQNTSEFSVKQEIIEPQESASSSHCPSVTSTSPPPSSDLESQQLALRQPIFAHPEQLNDLWMVSKAIRDKQLTLDANVPLLNRLRTRLEELDRERAILLETKDDAPNHDDMRHMWNLDREHLKLGKEFAVVNMNIQNANHWLPLLESRRNELLSSSPPTMPASFV